MGIPKMAHCGTSADRKVHDFGTVVPNGGTVPVDSASTPVDKAVPISLVLVARLRYNKNGRVTDYIK